MTYYIYLFLCMLNGFVLGTADLGFKNWQFWVSVICVAAAYICGEEKRK